MARRSRLPRKPIAHNERRLRVTRINDHKLWTFRLGEKKLSYGFYGKIPKSEEMFMSEPPFYKIILPPKDAQYVKIDWKKGILYTIDGKPFGKLPRKLKWEKYVPVKIYEKGHPMTVMEEELKELKERAREIRKRAEARKILKEAGIEPLPKVPLREKIKPAYWLKKLKEEIP